MKLKKLIQKFSLEKTLEFFLELSYLAIIFSIPLYFSFNFALHEIFNLSKFLLFAFLLAFFLLFFVAWLSRGAKYRYISALLKDKQARVHLKVLIPVYILMLVLVLSVVFSQDPSLSFWGSYIRQLGFLSYLLFFIWSQLLFFYLLIKRLSLGEEVFWSKIKRIVWVALITAILVALYGILQILNIDYTGWSSPPYITKRALSTLGQPNFLASFLLLPLPLVFYLFKKTKSFWPKYFLAFAGLIITVCIFFTGSRGAFLAIAFVVGVFILKLLFSKKLSIKRRLSYIFLSLLALSLSIATLYLVMPERMKTITAFHSGSQAVRVNLYQNGANAILQKPILGYGLENIGRVYIGYYDRDWGLFESIGVNADRAHNFILDTLLSTGFIGLIAFLLWYYLLIKLSFTFSKDKYCYLGLALGAGVIAYLASLFFSFTIISGELYLWLFFSLLAVLYFSENFNQAKFDLELREPRRNLGFIIFVFTSFVFAGALIIFSERSYRVDRSIGSLVSDIREDRIESVLNRYQDLNAISISPTSQLEYLLADSFAKSCVYGGAGDEAKEELIKSNLEVLIGRLDSLDYQSLAVKLLAYSCLGENEKAMSVFNQLKELAPNWTVSNLEMARHLLRQGEVDQALAVFFQLELLFPDLDSPLINDEHRAGVMYYKFLVYYDLARYYYQEADYRNAIKFYGLAYKNRSQDYLLLKKIADCYYILGEKEEALQYTLIGYSMAPSDHIWSQLLAFLYNDLGQRDKAEAYMDLARKFVPEEQAEELETYFSNFSKL